MINIRQCTYAHMDGVGGEVRSCGMREWGWVSIMGGGESRVGCEHRGGGVGWVGTWVETRLSEKRANWENSAVPVDTMALCRPATERPRRAAA